jgi:hypothetical protein
MDPRLRFRALFDRREAGDPFLITATSPQPQDVVNVYSAPAYPIQPLPTRTLPQAPAPSPEPTRTSPSNGGAPTGGGSTFLWIGVAVLAFLVVRKLAKKGTS